MAAPGGASHGWRGATRESAGGRGGGGRRARDLVSALDAPAARQGDLEGENGSREAEGERPRGRLQGGRGPCSGPPPPPCPRPLPPNDRCGGEPATIIDGATRGGGEG